MLYSFKGYTQIRIPVSARVDTSDVEKMKVYGLYSAYLNNRPDSVFLNPYWNVEEGMVAYRQNRFPDLSARILFYEGMDFNRFIQTWQPKVLQIEKVTENRYMVKTIFMSMCESDIKLKAHTPIAITKLYAVRRNGGEYKLENTVSYDLRTWKVRKEGNIVYYVHPYLVFNKAKAKKAVRFCKSVVRQLKLKELPQIDYYLTPNSDEMWKLFDFEYYLYGGTGLADIKAKKVYVSIGAEDYLHELVHQIMPIPQNSAGVNHNLITEGIATWLAGPKYGQNYSEALCQLSKQFEENCPDSLNDIVCYKYRNKFDNSVFYLTGAVICQMAFNKGGLAGFWSLYNCPNDWGQLKKRLSSVLGGNYEKDIINYIFNYRLYIMTKPLQYMTKINRGLMSK